MYNYKKIVKIAKEIRKNVQTKQKLGRSTKWSYYFCKIILDKKDVEKIPITKAFSPQQSKMSKQVKKADYLKLIKQYVDFVQLNNRLPNYIIYDEKKIKPRMFCYTLAKIIRYREKYGKLPKTVTISSYVFNKPVTNNEVYNAFVKKFGEVKSIDGALQIISDKFSYEFYFDDRKSNLQVIKDQAGNCTDLTQMLANVGEALGYKVKCIHVQCRTSGTGHVFLKLKHDKHTGGSWITRDPSAVCGGNSIYNIWCSNGIVLGEGDEVTWWLENKNR